MRPNSSKAIYIANLANQTNFSKTGPFSYGARHAVFAQHVFYFSPGGAPWGLKCPSGAVVASDQTTTPYCLQLGASSEPCLMCSHVTHFPQVLVLAKLTQDLLLD